MFGLGAIVLIIALFFLGYGIVQKSGRYSYEYDDQIIVSAICIVLLLVATIAMNVAQISHQENINSYKLQMDIQVERVQTLLPVLTKELKAYPDYEKDMVSSLYEGKSSAVIVPIQLRNDKMVSKLVDEVKGAYDKIYDIKFKVVKEYTGIRINNRAGQWFCIWVNTYEPPMPKGLRIMPLPAE
jgi:hypothetical protein